MAVGVVASLGRLMLRLTTLGATDLQGVDGDSVKAVLAGPKRLALLAYLATARPHGFHRRDVLLALLWPEVDQDRGRATLRTTLYHLRQALGSSVIRTRGDDEVGIDATELTADAVEFERALEAGRTADALALYRGDFMRGLYVSGAPEWERWLETERARLRNRAASAAWSLAEDAASAQNAEQANRWARRAHEIQPDDEGGLRRLIAVLDQIGDRSGAIAAYEKFARDLFEEYGSEPAPETRKLIQSVRARVELLAEPQLRARAVKKVAHTPELNAPPSRRRMRVWIAAGSVSIIALTFAAFGLTRSSAAPVVVLAVGDIKVLAAPDSLAGFPLLLSTNLARVPGLGVISDGRMHEVLATLREKRGASVDLSYAAARAGATEIVEGTLAQRARGGFRLDLRRTNVRTGATVGALSVESTEIFDLVDLATEWVAEQHGVQAASSRYAANTASLVSYRLYEQGLAAYYKNDMAVAQRFFRTALAEDSTFAMAAYFLSRIVSVDESWALLERAARLSQRGTDRERLIIMTAWKHYAQDPGGLAIAETLAVRYPVEPEGHLLYARSLIIAGAFTAAIPHLERVIEMDSLGRTDGNPRCWSCEAYERLGDAYFALDSFPALERLARRELRTNPKSVSALYRLRSAYTAAEQFDRAMALGQTAAQLRGAADFDYENADPLMRAGEFARLERLWQRHLVAGDRAARESAYFGQTLLYRAQGRFGDAIVAATNLRHLASQPPARPEAFSHEAGPLAAALMDARRYREAAALYDSIAASRAAPTESRHARHVAWTLAHAAGAYAALGDTARLRVIEDSVRAAGSRSAYMRDQLLHHYVHGLRLMVQGNPAAATLSFRRSLYSTTSGYSRINLQLARAYLSLNRPKEAIAILEAGLRGPVGATGMYTARTELQELLGQAYDRAGDRARAAIQYRRVLHAWAHADAELADRREYIRRRLDTGKNQELSR